MLKFLLFLSFFTAIFYQNVKAQKVSCQVLDQNSGKPLAFVNIRFDDSQSGATTDINGRVELDNRITTLHFFYIGYRDTLVIMPKGKSFFEVNMKPAVIDLAEVVILPGENPAHRIILLAIKNRKKNRPENLHSFSYVSYNKMIFTAEPDTTKLVTNDSLPLDSSEFRLNKFINKQHFLLLESVSKRSYLEGKSHELVKVSRVSGLKDPSFMMLATQFQSFSFYEPQFTILGKNYINPLITGSISNYFYQLEDTLYQGCDTVFIITFRPLKNKSFDGMKGFVYVNTDGYAVQNVIAEPYSAEPGFGVKIQQLYEKIDRKAWFPTQLNTSLSFNTISINDKPMIGIGTTYLDSILIDPPLQRSLFRGKVSFEVAKNSTKVEETILNSYRKDSLTQRDINTYLFMDSLGKAQHFDRRLKTLQILSTGKIPYKIFSIPINQLVRFNEFEKWRFGLALETNDRLSKYFMMGGYLAWSTSDRVLKYGGELAITPKPNSDFSIKFNYINDLEESGAIHSFGRLSSLNSEIYRSILVDKMNRNETVSGAVQFRVFKYFLWNIGAEYSEKKVTDHYLYQIAKSEQVAVLGSDFNLLLFSGGFRFAWGEKLVRNSDKLLSLGTRFPVINIQFSHFIKNIFGDFEYNRFDFQADKIFRMRYLGQSNLQLKAGMTDRTLPAYLSFIGPASYRHFYVYSINSFNTMRINEFLSDRFIAVFWQHNFGKVIFTKNKLFTPDWLIVNNFGWGDLFSPEKHQNIGFKTMEKGYMETGFLLDKITTSAFTSLGFGVFYRYGPYAFTTVKENLAYRLVVGFNF